MGSIRIPFLDFNSDPMGLEQGTEGWDLWCTKVREACETLGCFVVAYDKIPAHLREEMFKGMKSLFDLPVETKMKNSSKTPYFGYIGPNAQYPRFESLGIEGATKLDAARNFTEIMWPDGDQWFSETINSMSKNMLELSYIIRKMIFDSLGLRKYYDSHVENCDAVCRLMKYNSEMRTPLDIGLPAHADKNMLSILCEDTCGLEVLTEEGSWVQVAPTQGAYIVFVGESLKAWSNGRFTSAIHRVVMSGDTERFSCGLFTKTKGGVMVETPPELVDNQHPLLFKPYNYPDFLRFVDYSEKSNMPIDKLLEMYAGV